MVLNFRGYAIYPSSENIEYVKENLTFIEQETDHNRYCGKKTVPCYWLAKAPEGEVGPINWYYVPREFGFRNFGVESYSYPEVSSVSLEFNGTLRDKQKWAINSVLNTLRDPEKGGGIANLYTGWGKTCGALYVITQLGVKSIIILNKLSLINQWKERIEHFIPSAKIGIIQEDSIPDDDCDIVLASLMTLCSKYESYRFSDFQKYGLLIVDEVHNISGEKVSRILKKMQLKYRLGLSATIKEDVFSEIYLQQIGPVIVTETKPTLLASVKVTNLSTSMELPMNKNGKLNHTRLLSELMLLECRNMRIARDVVDMVNNDKRRPLVVTPRRGHVDIIKNLIGWIDMSITVGIFVGKMKPTDIEQSLECQVLIGTSNAVTEALDHPPLDTLVFALPKSISTKEDKNGIKKKDTNSINQVIGRILRRENENKPLIYDYCDKLMGYCKLQQYNRNSYYKKRMFSIENAKE